MTFSSSTVAADYYRRIMRAKKQAWRQAGRCVCCGKPAVIKPNGQPMSRCQPCRETSTAASRAYNARPHGKTTARARRARYAAQARCQCGKPRAEGLRVCQACRRRNATSAAKYAAKKRTRCAGAGICLCCGRATGMNMATRQKYRYCLWHRIEQAEYRKKRRAEAKAKREA